MRPITRPVEKTANKTVYISMGTINQNRQFYRNCIDVLSQTGWQVIISMGTNTDSFADLPENIQVYESVDQMAVLSIADVFITHCGMNSASEGLYYGVQPFSLRHRNRMQWPNEQRNSVQESGWDPSPRKTYSMH